MNVINNFNSRFYVFPNKRETMEKCVMSLLERQVLCMCLGREMLSRADVLVQCPVERGQKVQDSSGSVSSGVGAGPRPSDDVDLGFIIQLIHDSLLFDGQDGVANWTTAG